MLRCLRQARGFLLAIPKKPITDNTFDPLELVQVLCKDFWDCRTGLSYFAKASLSPNLYCAWSATAVLMACPPRWLWMATARQNPRQSRRRKFFETRAKNAKPFALHAELGTLGQPKAPPPCAQLGAPISKQQPGVIERLEALLTHCLRMPQFHGHELGRAAGTFQGFIDSLQQLPDTHSGSGDLSDGQLNCKSTCLIFRSPRSQTAQLRRKLARSVEALFSDYA